VKVFVSIKKQEEKKKKKKKKERKMTDEVRLDVGLFARVVEVKDIEKGFLILFLKNIIRINNIFHRM